MRFIVKYYLDIHVQTPEALNAAFEKVHCAMQGNDQNIAISFPEYQYDPVERVGTFGSLVRLVATEQRDLMELIANGNLSDIVDATFSSVMPVPEKIKGYARFQRVQTKSKSDLNREAKNLVKKGYVKTLEEALKQVSSKKRYNPYPSLRIKSLSRKRFFYTHIVREFVRKPIRGSFNSYGLSTSDQRSTVPIF